MVPFSKEDRILIKSLYECKGYNARQFITDLGCWWSWESSEQPTGDWAAADRAVHVLMKTSTHYFWYAVW